MEGQLQNAMKAVGQAIQLDSGGNSRNAYLHYLSCMQYISQSLLQDARVKASQPSSANQLKTKTTAKMVKLAHQCSERVADIMANMDESPITTATLNLPPTYLARSRTPSPTPPSTTAGRISPSMFPSVPNMSHSLPTHVAVVRPTVQPYRPLDPYPAVTAPAAPTTQAGSQVVAAGAGWQGPQPGSAGQLSMSVPSQNWQRDDTLSPLEKAYRENRKLMAAYQSRLSRMQTSRNKSMVNLTFQRRLLENMAIAKAREASLAKKIKERQLRLQEQAAQRFSSGGQPTKEEMEKREVFANILEYENTKNWLREWRDRLQASPKDLKLIHDLIHAILSCEEHPLTQLVKRYQITIYHKLMPLIQKELVAIEENVVPYKGVVPLELQEARQVPEGGFTTPDELDESMDDMLAKRLHALREGSTSSGIDSDTSETQNIGQTEGVLFIPSEMSDDLLDDLLLSDDDESQSHEEKSREQSDMIVDEQSEINGAGSHRTKRDGDDIKHMPEKGNSSDSTNRTGELSSGVTSESATRTSNGDGVGTNGDDTDGGRRDTINADVGDDSGDSISEAINEFKDGIDETRDDLEKAMNEGEKLRQTLENDDKEVKTSANDEGNDDTNDDGDNDEGVVMTTDDASSDVEVEGDNSDKPEMETDTTNSSDTSEIKRTSVENGESGRTTNNGAQVNGDSTIDLQPAEPRSDGNHGNGTASKVDDSHDASNEDKGDGEEGQPEDNGAEIAEMKAEALRRHVKNISKDVLLFTERLQSLLVAVYDQLDSTIAKEQCIAVIEAYFFKDIWQPLLMLFRRFNFQKEKAAAIAMTKYQHAMPQHIGVHEKFCLLREGAIHNGSQAPTEYPYQPAVEEFTKIKDYSCPLEKLECVVRVSRVIIECVGDFCESQGKPRKSPETTVGCDDLLPILSYVIMKSSLPQVVSECSAMEEFIHEGYLFGEEGYCLTTCQTALSYVLKLGSTEESTE